MTSRRAMVARTASNIITLLLLFNLFSTFMHVAFGYVLHWYLFMAVPFFLLCWLWRRVNSLYVFLLWFVGVAAVTVLAANFFRTGSPLSFADPATIIVFIGLISFRFVYVWMRGQELEPEISTAVWLFAVHAALYGAVHFLGRTNEALLTQLTVTYLFMVMLILLCVHMSNVELRLVVLQESKASKAVLAANNRLIAAFAGVVLAVGGLIVMVNPMRGVGWLIGRIGLLAGFLTRRRTGPVDVPQQGAVAEEIPLEFADVEFYDWDYYMYGDVPYYVREQALNIVWISQLVFVGALVAVCIYFLAGRVTNRRRARRAINGADFAQALETSLLDDLLGLLPRRLKLRHPVRRAYARKVNRYIRAGTKISASDTTDIIRVKIIRYEDISSLTAMYEKVRYGPDVP